MTRMTTLAFGIGASLILAAGAANAAGTCGAEVTALQEKLGHQQGANATIGATDPGVQQPAGGASIDSSASGANSTATTDSDTVATDNSGANATIGATDPGVQQPAPEANSSTSTSSSTGATADTNNGSSGTTGDNTGANATIGASDPGVQQPDGGGSDAITENSAEAAASGSTDTMPSGTATDASRVGEMNTAAGSHAAAITALKKAQLAADAGNEETCMTELGTAKAALGME
jgi:hypothetical protein